ncbi:MAG: BrnT family toxin [Deltaproteobacteria bacterium]|nr:BrnT family toxin [Deltaproteobacteria bacterium]
MRFEWDEAKRRANLRKHAIDFAGVDALFDGLTLTVADDRLDYGEARFLTVGLLEGRTAVVAHTERGDTIRILSVRKATKHEEAHFLTQVADQLGTRRRPRRPRH